MAWLNPLPSLEAYAEARWASYRYVGPALRLTRMAWIERDWLALIAARVQARARVWIDRAMTLDEEPARAALDCVQAALLAARLDPNAVQRAAAAAGWPIGGAL